MSELLSQRLAPERAPDLPDAILMRHIAALWADPETRTTLHGTTQFFEDRLRHFGARGYLTARERQGILRLLFTGAVPIHRRLQALERRRAEATDDAPPAPELFSTSEEVKMQLPE